MNNEPNASVAAPTEWRTLVTPYQEPDTRQAVWQLINSFGGLGLCWGLMYLSLSVGYWLTLLLAAPAAGFLVRVFIIQHDCGHGSFLKTRRRNDTIGIICSIFTLIPYKFWRKSHAVHHAHHAELEERGIGDIWTLTVDEFKQARWWKRATYRVFRHPLFLFGLAPTVNFVLIARFPLGGQTSGHNRERASVWWTNLAIAGWVAAASALVGLGSVLLISLPIIAIAGSVGTWLFYVQHQFECTYWEHTPQWDYTLAALHGSSYYQLPQLLQWFTGSIGFHHIHHLSPRIPNYHLQKCHEQNPSLQRVVHLTLKSSLQTAWLTLWHEKERRLISFQEALQTEQWTARHPLTE